WTLRKKEPNFLSKVNKQLLKLQLGEARQKLHLAKQDKKEAKAMLTAAAPSIPAPGQVPVPVAQPGPHISVAPRWQSGFQGWRGRRGRAPAWSGVRGRGARGWKLRDRCLYCGEEGHWVRQCPHYTPVAAQDDALPSLPQQPPNAALLPRHPGQYFQAGEY
uniref:CCHC-type domain-containing protein n=1 Tax=Xiphophorus maculatus TaxID=8083 RepID=A0A3B5Q034_XIPMA